MNDLAKITVPKSVANKLGNVSSPMVISRQSLNHHLETSMNRPLKIARLSTPPAWYKCQNSPKVPKQSVARCEALSWAVSPSPKQGLHSARDSFGVLGPGTQIAFSTLLNHFWVSNAVAKPDIIKRGKVQKSMGHQVPLKNETGLSPCNCATAHVLAERSCFVCLQLCDRPLDSLHSGTQNIPLTSRPMK